MLKLQVVHDKPNNVPIGTARDHLARARQSPNEIANQAHQLCSIITGLIVQVPRSIRRRIGKAVKLCYVPSAVMVTVLPYTTDLSNGLGRWQYRLIQSQKTGLNEIMTRKARR